MARPAGPEIPAPYLTTAEVAALLGIRTRTVVLWTQRYALPCVRISGSVIRYRLAEVEEWVRRRSAAESAEAASVPPPGPRKRGRPRRRVGGAAGA